MEKGDRGGRAEEASIWGLPALHDELRARRDGHPPLEQPASWSPPPWSLSFGRRMVTRALPKVRGCAEGAWGARRACSEKAAAKSWGPNHILCSSPAGGRAERPGSCQMQSSVASNAIPFLSRFASQSKRSRAGLRLPAAAPAQPGPDTPAQGSAGASRCRYPRVPGMAGAGGTPWPTTTPSGPTRLIFPETTPS